MSPGLIVSVRIIQRVVQATTLAPQAGTVNDQFSHGSKITQLQQVTCHQEVPVVVPNLFLNQGNAPPGTFQATITADDANIVPHQSTNLFPRMRHHYHLITVDCVTWIPVRKHRRCVLISFEKCGGTSKHTMSKHYGFE